MQRAFCRRVGSAGSRRMNLLPWEQTEITSAQYAKKLQKQPKIKNRLFYEFIEPEQFNYLKILNFQFLF